MKLFSYRSGLGVLLVLCIAGCATRSGGGSAGAPQQQPTSRAQASAKIHTELAAQYYERAQLGVALEELNYALQADSGYAPAYNVRGLVRMDLRQYQQAEEDFQESLHLDGSNSEAHNNYGWFLCQRGKEADAIEHFMAALKNPLYQTPEKALLNAGLCSIKAGKSKDAEDFLNKALRIQPEMPEALQGMAQVNFTNGDFANAKSYLLRYSKGKESTLTAENLWLAIRIERKLGNRKAANDYANQLRQRFPYARETQLLQPK